MQEAETAGETETKPIRVFYFPCIKDPCKPFPRALTVIGVMMLFPSFLNLLKPC